MLERERGIINLENRELTERMAREMDSYMDLYRSVIYEISPGFLPVEITLEHLRGRASQIGIDIYCYMDRITKGMYRKGRVNQYEY